MESIRDAPASCAEVARLGPGDVVAERYRILDVLGEGGMGIVYRAEHLHLRKPFALKVLLPAYSSTPEIVARFEREAIAAGNVDSPHVAAATDFGRLPDGSFFLVLEYIDGRTLRSALESGALEPARALHVLRGIVSALQAAHGRGIVHRDLKPENVMLVQRDGDPDFVKVLDFGIAKLDATVRGSAAPAQPLTQLGAVMGTPEYMSPEQALGQPVDARSDLYAAGVILHEMLTGQCPFVGGAVTVLRQHVLGEVPTLAEALATGIDPRVGAILRRLLAKAPESRFASAAELASALDELSRPATPAAPFRPSLGSVPAVSTPVARRIQRSVVVRLKTVESFARRSIAEPRLLVAHARRGAPFAAAALVSALIASALAGRGSRHASPDPSLTHAAAAPTASAVGAPPASPVDEPGSPRPLDLPPPPSPTGSSQATPNRSPAPASAPGTSSSQGAHRTGPGGIYIPPPSRWFK